MTISNIIRCGGKLLDCSSPQVMGILNVTPDSFYDGGRHFSEKNALERTRKMLGEGAAILDVGGMSSRPGAEPVAIDEEKRRVLPVIRAVVKEFPDAILSVDTVWAEVARAAVGEGATMVNDISAGGMDEGLLPAVAELGVPYVLMHMQGRPQTMQQEPRYDDVVLEIMDFFIKKIGDLRELGLKDILLDPGFGFGKTLGHNYQILAKMREFQILGCPVLAGLSRKSMIYKHLGINSEQALNGTTAVHMLALQGGACMLRTHDVREAVECIKIWEAYQDGKAGESS